MARDLRLQIDGDDRGGRKALDSVADGADEAALTLRGLAAEMKKAAREGGHLEGELKDVGGTAKVAGAELGGTAKQADKLGDELSEAARAAAKLDASLATVRGNIGRLNKELAAGGDQGDVVKQLQKQYAEYDKIERVKKRIAGDGKQVAKAEDDTIARLQKQFAERDRIAHVQKRVAKDEEETRRSALSFLGKLREDVGSGFAKGGFGGASSAVSGALGTPVLGPALLAAGAAAAIPAASFVGGAAGGGVLAGLGVGGAALGLAGAWQSDPDKYAAKWNAATDKIKKRWLDSSKAFGNELDGVLKTADQTLQRLPVERVLALSQSFVSPLASGAGQGLAASADGFADALERVQPVVDRLGPEIANLGNDVGDAFRIISQGSEGGADALGDFVNFVGYAVKAAAILILGFENAYEAERKFWSGVKDGATSIPVLGGAISDLGHWMFDIGSTAVVTGRSLKEAGDAGHNSADGWLDAVKAGAELTLQAHAANDALTELRNTQLGMADANVAVAQGWLDLSEELKEGAKSLDLNTQEGINNEKAIISQVKALEQQREQAIATSDGSAEAIAKANAAYDAQVEKIRAAAYAAGFDKQKVDELIASLGAVPPSTKADIRVDGLKPALDQGISLGNALNNIDGYHAHAVVDVSYQGYNPGIALGNLLHRARGGTSEGGPTVMGEHGSEIAWLNRGQYVSTAEETRKLTSMMGGTSGGSPQTSAMALQVMPGADRGVGQLVQYLIDRGYVQAFAGGQQISTRR